MSTFQGRSAALATTDHQAPAVRADDPAALMQVDMQLATSLAKSKLLPRAYDGKPENVLIAIGLGRALGLDAVPSLYSLHVIEGTPSPSAKLQQALVRRARHKFRVIESTSERAVVEIVRHDDPDYPVRTEFTIEDARAAGYLDQWAERWVQNGQSRRPERWYLPRHASVPPTEADLQGAPQWVTPQAVKRRDNWFTNPKAMLFARATTACVGQACAEVLSGIDFDTAWDAPEYDAPAVTEPADGPSEQAPDAQPDEPADVVDAEIVDDGGDAPPADAPAVDHCPDETWQQLMRRVHELDPVEHDALMAHIEAQGWELHRDKLTAAAAAELLDWKLGDS